MGQSRVKSGRVIRVLKYLKKYPDGPGKHHYP
jgi:hypothetical protein